MLTQVACLCHAGTASAFHLLAALLKQQTSLKVTFLGVTKEIETCAQAQKVYISPASLSNSQGRLAALGLVTCVNLCNLMLLKLSMAGVEVTHAAQVHKAGGLDFECLQERHFESPKVVETYPYEALSVITHCVFCTSSQCQCLTSCTIPISMVMTDD